MDQLYASVMLPLAAIETDPGYERLFPPLSAEDRAQLADSIKRVGLIAPLCVTRRDDRWILLDGHHRLRVLQDLGWAAAPCLVARDAVHEVELLYSANLQRRQLTPEHRQRLLDDFTLRLAQVNHCVAGPLLDELHTRVCQGEITTAQLVAKFADVWPAPPPQPAAAGEPRAAGEAEDAGLRQRAEDAERRLKLARQEFERLIERSATICGRLWRCTSGAARLLQEPRWMRRWSTPGASCGRCRAGSATSAAASRTSRKSVTN